MGLTEEVISASQKNEELADRLYPTALNACWASIEEATDTARKCALLFESLDDEKLHNLLLIGTNVLSDLISSLMNLRQGFFHPPALVIRGAVENLACIVAFQNDDKHYKDYLAGTFDKPFAITPAKKLFDRFGHLYGSLTQNFTHEPVEMLGRGVADFDGKLGYSAVPPLDKINRASYLQIMCYIALSASLSGEILEWVFGSHLTELTYWEFVSPVELKSKDCVSKRKGLELSDELKQALAELKTKT